MSRSIFLAGLVWVVVAASMPEASAQEETVVTTEVKTRKTEKRDHESLRFLRDNRDFLRSQLDRLRLDTTWERRGSADNLDARYLKMQELAAAIASARDTVDHEGAELERRELMASVSELRDLEMQLDLMDSLLVDQGLRLTWLEEDFLGRQETALVILLKGSPGEDAPAGLVLTDGNETLHVTLDDTQIASLARGGIVQVDHRLVEPRAHTIAISLEGGDWETRESTVVEIKAQRDKMTFLELDLSGLDPKQPMVALGVDVWQR